ncbi:MAG: preprotein translocase subunit SecG [Chitinophagaceae bacterium]
MAVLFLILIMIACIILGFIVLVQNPKGGGLSGTIAGFNNQFMGVKQTTDVLEKGTWIFAAIIGVLCIISTLFFKGGEENNNKFLQNINTSTAPANTQQTAPANTTTLPADSTKK